MPKSSGGDPVTIYTSMGPLRAQLIKSKLEAAGIPVLLRYESAGLAIGIIVDGLGAVHVQVPQEFEEEALALIEPMDGEVEEIADDEWGQEWDESRDDDTPEG